MNTENTYIDPSPRGGQGGGFASVEQGGGSPSVEQGAVSIVILNWNGSVMMQKYLPTVVANSGDAEVVVADNASTDDSLEMLAREFPMVRVVRLEKNWGFADGYNKAFAKYEEENKAQGKTLPRYYVLLNSDVRVGEGWLNAMTAYMDAHEEVAACQPKLLSDVRPTHFEYAGACGGYMDKYGYPFCRGRVFDTVEEDHGQYDDVTEVLWATGACLMVRREDYWQVGGLDGRFFAHCEEIDFCWRLNMRGRKVVCVPQSVAYHLGGGTLPQGNPRKTYLNFRNNLTMLYKNLPQRRLRRVMLVRMLLDYVAAFQMLLLGGGVGDFKAVLKARRDFKKWKHQFKHDREQIQQTAIVGYPNSIKDYSVLYRYYLRGKKTM